MKVSAFTAGNLALALALELAAFSALGYGAFNLAGSTAVGALLAVGALVAATGSWGAFAAPRARYRQPLVTIPVKVLIFAGAVIALAVNAHIVLGVALGVTVGVNTLSLHSYNQRDVVRPVADSAAGPAAATRGVTVVGWLVAAWCLGFATVNLVFEVTGHFVNGPLAEDAVGISVVDWFVFVLKLLGAVAALLSVRRLPRFVSANLLGVVLWGAAALLGLYSLGSVVEAIGMITGLTGNADDITLASVAYVIFFLLAAAGYVVLAISFSRRHGIGKSALLIGVLGAPLMLGLILAAIPALLTAMGLLPGQ